jgi:2-hydroxy-3-oxopropionate reductase
MGSPMACNLVGAGHDVVGYTRTRAKSEPLVAAGGTATDTLAEAVTDAEMIITMLPDSPDVQAVILGDEGVLAHAKPGALIVDMSTSRRRTTLRSALLGSRPALMNRRSHLSTDGGPAADEDGGLGRTEPGGSIRTARVLRQ